MSVSAAAAREMLLYMLWADRQMLKAVRGVRLEDLTRDAGVSFGSMLGTMAHILGSQRMWLSRFSGQGLSRVPGPADFPDLLSWITAWEETASGIEAFLAALGDEQLATPITWTTTRGDTYTRPLWQPVLHLVNHSTYHRGQVTSLLRQMGYPPPSTDLNYYFLER
ncbi:MAG TPA: DinB family protein [Thermoanaerobaculia bacterium]